MKMNVKWMSCSVSKQTGGCLFSAGWILQAVVLSLPCCLSCGQVLASGPLWLPLTFPLRLHTQSWTSSVLFVDAIQGLLCPSSFLPQSADGLSSLSGFFVLSNDGKQLWSSVLSVTAWASGSHTPLAVLRWKHIQGVVDSGVHPAEKTCLLWFSVALPRATACVGLYEVLAAVVVF